MVLLSSTYPACLTLLPPFCIVSKMYLFLRPLLITASNSEQTLQYSYKQANIWEGRRLSAESHPSCSWAYVTPWACVTPKSSQVMYPSFKTGRQKTHSCIAPPPLLPSAMSCLSWRHLSPPLCYETLTLESWSRRWHSWFAE